MSDLTPSKLFATFKIPAKSWTKQLRLSRKALDDFEAVSDKKSFLKPTIDYLENEESDTLRAWGTSILGLIGTEQAFEYLFNLLNKDETPEVRRKFLFTRFFALLAIKNIAKSKRPALMEKVEGLCQKIWQDNAEDYLVQAEAAALLAVKGQSEPLHHLKQMLSKSEYWPVVRTLRALNEIPVPELVPMVLGLMKDTSYKKWDFRWHAIRAAGSFTNNKNVLNELGNIVQEETTNYLRLEAVKSLGKLRDPAAKEYLLSALLDEDAEIRCQAAISMKNIFATDKEAVAAVIQTALDPGTELSQGSYFVEALRQIDPARTIPTEILSSELSAEDRSRAETAEKLLVDLGGWAAVQRLSQRRLTLNRLDGLLNDSEKVVHDMFQGTIRQAQFNFYFAMAVNMIIVLTGLVLVGLAIRQLVANPQNLASWILPGATGVFGVLINLVFNNPRHNARTDLNALMTVTVNFFGFLRKLNEIDATFKYLYLESTDFNTERMHETITEIQQAVSEAIQFASGPSLTTEPATSSTQPQMSPVSEQNLQFNTAPK